MAAPPRADDDRLRAEHDALAERLSIRRSVDEVRKAAYSGFATFIVSGLAVKLAYDRWFSTRITRFKGAPVYFFVALAVALVLATLTVRWWVRSRRLMRAEDADFARLRELRDRLGVDP